MNGMHLTEEAIQQYVLEPWACAKAVQAHMEDCVHCRQVANEYKLLFSGLKEQERPAFDFDLAEMVAVAIEKEGLSYGVRGKSNRMASIYFGAALFAAGLITGLWWKWTLIKSYSTKYFHTLNTNSNSDSLLGFSRLTLFITLVAACIILLIQAFEIYGRYRKKITDLNFY